MTPNGQIAIPLDKAAIREPFLTLTFENCTQARNSREAARAAHDRPRGRALLYRSCEGCMFGEALG